MFIRGSQRLLNKADDSGGGGGGDGEKPPAPLTPEAIAQMVNSAVTSQLKRTLEKTMAEALSPFKAEIEALKSIPKPKDEAPSGEKKPDPQIAALTAQLEDLKKTAEQDRKAREAAETRARDDRAYQDLRTELTAKVRPEALDHAAKLLFHADKRVTFDENGAPLMTIRRAPYQGAAEEDMLVPLADGVNHWAKSKEAAIFIPAPGGNNNGGGDRRPGARNAGVGTNGLPKYDAPATTDEEKARRSLEVEQSLISRGFGNGNIDF